MAKESKVSHKDLAYDKTLPPFLQRIQQGNAGPATYQSARPKKTRNVEDEAEDEPVYFDEVTNSTLTKSEWEKAEAEKEEEEGRIEGDGRDVDGEGKRGDGEGKEKAVIGVSRKRKAGKVVGGGDEEGDEKGAAGEVKKVGGNGGEKKGEKEKAKAGKKAKKVKLSFGDDE